jgi:di/tricarboxylate transporter|tara:strand:- start:84 stop:290 length:207 start_codon:yes stop_codon:yes gene_type:complete
MGRAFWWISTGIMLVVFMPVGILLLGITLIKEICNIFNDDVEEVKVKKKSKKKFKSKDYSEEVLSEYR